MKFWIVNVDIKISMPRFFNGFKKCCINICNNVAQKLKEMADIHPNKIESEANSETFAGTAKCILIIARHYMPE